MRRPSGFPDEILLTWSPIERRDGEPTDLGYFPRAEGHFRWRPEGCEQSIVLFCLEGRGYVRWRDHEEPLEPGEVFLIPQGEPHRYRADDLHPWTLQWAHWRDTSGRPGGRRRLTAPVFERARDHFSDVLALASRAGYESETAHALAWWLTLVLDQPPLAPQGVIAPSPVADAVHFMAQHLGQRQTLEQLASVAHLSPSRFSAVFRRETGSAPMAHLQRLRMQKARALLERSALGVEGVARAVGYDDALHFSRVFRKSTGVSPRAWRRNPRG